jgi:hypothetical protein
MQDLDPIELTAQFITEHQLEVTVTAEQPDITTVNIQFAPLVDVGDIWPGATLDEETGTVSGGWPDLEPWPDQYVPRDGYRGNKNPAAPQWDEEQAERYLSSEGGTGGW